MGVPSSGGSTHRLIADGGVTRGNWRRGVGVDETSTLMVPILSCVKGEPMRGIFGLVIMFL